MLFKHCRLYENKNIIPEPQYYNEISIETLEQFQSFLKVKPDYYLIISKDPYSWYLSYKSWAKKCNWPDVKHHYIEEYNLFYKTFMKISSQSDKFIFIRYIDLVKDTNLVLSRLSIKMKLKKKFFSHLKFRMPAKVSQSKAFSEVQRTYYLNEKYLDEYSKEDMEAINALIDLQVISFLGYESRSIAK